MAISSELSKQDVVEQLLKQEKQQVLRELNPEVEEIAGYEDHPILW